MSKLLIAGLVIAVALSGCSNEPAADHPSAAGTADHAPASAPETNAVFQANCASCHKVDEDATGPALKGALARWDNDTARLKRFIRNWGEVTASKKDPRANELSAKWGTMMLSFPSLTDAELDSLFTLMK